MPTVAKERGEVMRVVLHPDMKAEFQAKCKRNGQKMSERTRQLIAQDLAAGQSAAQRLDAILSSAKEKSEASGIPSLSIEDIDAFIERVRSERIEAGAVQ